MFSCAAIFLSGADLPEVCSQFFHVMNLSIVCARMGGGGRGGGRTAHRKFDIFRVSNVNFPNLGSPSVKFPPLGTTDLAKLVSERNDRTLPESNCKFPQMKKAYSRYLAYGSALVSNFTHILYCLKYL